MTHTRIHTCAQSRRPTVSALGIQVDIDTDRRKSGTRDFSCMLVVCA